MRLDNVDTVGAGAEEKRAMVGTVGTVGTVGMVDTVGMVVQWEV